MDSSICDDNEVCIPNYQDSVCDVFVSLDIPEHLAVSYIKNMAMS